LQTELTLLPPHCEEKQQSSGGGKEKEAKFIIAPAARCVVGSFISMARTEINSPSFLLKYWLRK